PDLIATVVSLLRQAVFEDDEAGDDVRSLDVGNIRALNAQGRLVHPESLLKVTQGCGACGDVPGALQLVLCQRLGGIGVRIAQQRLLIATLRDPDGDLGATQFAEPRPETS